MMGTGLLACVHLHAQDKTSPEADLKVTFQVVAQHRIPLGNRALILNRVTPPQLPPLPISIPSTTQTETVAAAAFDAGVPLPTPPKKHELLFLIATVYDHRITEVQWFNGQREYRVFSNIDFNHLAGVNWFETEDTEYMLLMGIRNEASALQETFSHTRSEYLVPEDGTSPDPANEELTALDALHVYYDANKERLAEDYTQREAARITREKWLKEHPRVPKDTIINFWLEEPVMPRNHSKIEFSR